MTYIKRLELRNFKSFGPKPIVINFDRGLNAITGPNGSGKSNISDGILFVLGENSPRQLRASGGKLSGLIYDAKSEAQGEKPKSCRVTIYFDNTDRTIPLDSDVVSVTREVLASGENNYYLNGRKVSRSSLLEILELAGISYSGLNIVPQGSATKVSDLTPEEKRKIIEDVVGISRFDEKKAEAQRQLAQADQRLEVAMARIGEMKTFLEQLDLQRNELARLNFLESQLNWLRAVITSKRIVEQRESIKQLLDKEKEITDKIEEVTKKINETEEKIANTEADRTRFIVDVIQGGGKGHVELQLQLAQVTEELDSLLDEIKQKEIQVEQLEKDTIPALRNAVSNKEKEVSRSKSIIDQLSLELQKYESKATKLNSDLSEVINALSILRDTLERNSRKAQRIYSKINELNEKLRDTEMQISSLSVNLNSESRRLAELKEKVSGYSSILSELEDNIKELSTIYGHLAQDLKSIDSSMSILEQKRKTVLSSIEKASEVLEKAEAEVNKARIISEVRDQIGESREEKKLRELCEKGGVPGYIGKLKEILSFDAEYSAAVRAVLGQFIDSYVVKDIGSMVRLIKAAKSLKVKKVKIIPVSEFGGIDEIKYEKSAGVIGPLSSFIRCSDDIKGLVNFLCGNTLMVSTQALAYLVSSEGYRAVTVSGEIFEPGTKMFLSGSYEPSLFLLEEIESEEEVREVLDAVEKLRQAIEKRKNEINKMEYESKALAKERTRKIADLSSMKAEIRTVSRISKKYRSIFRSLNQEYLKQERIVSKLQKKISMLEERKNSITKAISALGQVLETVKELGLESMISELEASRSQLESELVLTRNRIGELSLQISKEKANLENVLIRSLEDNKLDLESTQEEYNQIKDFLRQAPKTVKELQNQKESLGTQIEKLKEASRMSQPVLDEFENKIKFLKETRDSLQRQKSFLERELYALRSQKDRLDERLQEALSSLRMFGYSHEIEYFEGAEELLSEITSEYDSISRRVNRSAEKQYNEAYSQYKNLSLRYNELERERNAIISFIESVEKEKRNVFLGAYEKISKEFSEIFKRLTNGQAWLELENPDEIFTGGIMIYAKFGDKPAWESSSLSGGEKAVVGVSLILALQTVKEHPFYLFDEIDAALDAVNASSLADFLLDRSAISQIIVITLRDVIVSKASLVYGVYSTEGVSRIVHYRPAEIRS